MKKFFTVIAICVLAMILFVAGLLSGYHSPHQVIEGTSDGASDTTLLPLDSLHRIDCQTRYILIK